MRRLLLAAFIATTGLIALAYASAFIPRVAAWGTWCMIAGVTATALALLTSLVVFFVVSRMTRDQASADLDQDVALVMDA